MLPLVSVRSPARKANYLLRLSKVPLQNLSWNIDRIPYFNRKRDRPELLTPLRLPDPDPDLFRQSRKLSAAPLHHIINKALNSGHPVPPCLGFIKHLFTVNQNRSI